MPEPQNSSRQTLQHQDVRVDAHVDLPYFMARHAPKSTLSQIEDAPFTLRKAISSGVRLFFTAIYCEDRFNGQGSFEHFKEIFDVTLNAYDEVVVVKDRVVLEEGLETSEAVCTFFLLENADALVAQTAYVEQLRETGFRVVGLTHVGKNRLGDGNRVRFSDGLTKAGEMVVRQLVDHRILLDAAHLHPACFWQLMRICESPIISSHTGIREVCGTPRNLNLEQVKEIDDRGGVVGITFNPEMLSFAKKASLDDVFAHLDTVVQRFGPQVAGIGSDFCGFDGVTEGLEDISKIDSLTKKMEMHGYPEAAIIGIMGQNWLRVLEPVI
jgi:membrane dipeptidase